MPTLTVTKSITYEDATSGTSYDITTTKAVDVFLAYRDRMDLSPSTSTELFQNPQTPVVTGKVAYVKIKNIGANSAYYAFDDGSNDATIHEIPAGALEDFWGDDIYGATLASTQRTVQEIYIKGNTSIEVDIFL